MSLHGVDVSHWNGQIDYDAFTKSEQKYNDFVIAKSTQGKRFVDSEFMRNAMYCSHYSIPFGMYHFLDDTEDAVIQAHRFVSYVNIVRGMGLMPLLALDVEEDGLKKCSNDVVFNMVLNFVAEVYSRTECYPLIYLSYGFRNKNMFSEIGKYCGGWIARYSDKPAKRPDLNVTIRQFTNQGRVVGIKGNVDLNDAYLTREGWARLSTPQ